MDGSTFFVMFNKKAPRAIGATKKTMKKNLLVLVLLFAGMGFNCAFAQDKDVSIGVQGAFNPNKTGVGVRVGFDFTEILRFTIDGTYYLTAKKTIDVFQGETISRTLNNGRLWDGNINLNFVFGRKKVNFYLISGIGITYGYKINGISEAIGGVAYDHTDANGNVLGYGIDEDDVDDYTRFGVSLNAGFGIEWQIVPAIRWNLEQTVNWGLPSLSTWMCKTGLVYCF